MTQIAALEEKIDVSVNQFTDKQAIFKALAGKNPYLPEHARGFYFYSEKQSPHYIHREVIQRGLRALKRAELLTKENQAAVIAAGEYAFEMGLGLELLSDANIPLTEKIYLRLIKAGKHATELAKLFIYLDKVEKANNQRPSFFSWGSTKKIPSSSAYAPVDTLLKKLKEIKIEISESVYNVICFAHLQGHNVDNFFTPLTRLKDNEIEITDDILEIIANHIANPEMPYLVIGFIQLRQANVPITDKIKEVLFNKNNKYNSLIKDALIRLNKANILLTDSLLDAISKMGILELDIANFDGRISIAIEQFRNAVPETEILSMLLQGSNVSLRNIAEQLLQKEVEKKAIQAKRMHEKSIDILAEELKQNNNIILSPKLITILKAFSPSDVKNIFCDPLHILIAAGIPFTDAMQDVFFTEDSGQYWARLNLKVANALVSLRKAEIQLTHAILNTLAIVAYVPDDEDETAAQCIAQAIIYLAEQQIKLTGDHLSEFRKNPHLAVVYVATIVQQSQYGCPSKARRMLQAHDIQLSGIVDDEFKRNQKNVLYIPFAILLIQLKRHGILLTVEQIEILYFAMQFDLNVIKAGIASLYNVGIPLTPYIFTRIVCTKYCAETAAMGLIFLKSIGLDITDELAKVFFDSYVKIEGDGKVSHAITQSVEYVITQQLKAILHQYYQNNPLLIDLIISYVGYVDILQNLPQLSDQTSKIVIETAEFPSIPNDELDPAPQRVKVSLEGGEALERTSAYTNDKFELIKQQNSLFFKVAPVASLQQPDSSQENSQQQSVYRLTLSRTDGTLL